MTKFSQAVVNIVRQIPLGKVVSYGQVAAYVGVPRAARQVGWILRQLEGVDIPWWRVVNNAGRVTIKGNKYVDAHTQRGLLRGEGVGVRDDFSLDIDAYRFVADQDKLKEWGLPREYRDMIWQKFSSRLIVWIAIPMFLLFGVGKVQAHEGRIVLRNGTLACEGISVWKDQRFRVIGRCSGLVYPYQEKINNYLLWGQPDDNSAARVIDNIEVGFWEGSIDRDFSQVFITAEGNTSPRLPSDIVLASGAVQQFDFSPSQIVAFPTPTPVVKPVVTAVSTNFRWVLVTVPIILFVLLGVVVGIIVLSRRG